MVALATVTLSETVIEKKTKPLFFSWMNPAPEWTGAERGSEQHASPVFPN